MKAPDALGDHPPTATLWRARYWGTPWLDPHARLLSEDGDLRYEFYGEPIKTSLSEPDPSTFRKVS